MLRANYKFPLIVYFAINYTSKRNFFFFIINFQKFSKQIKLKTSAHYESNLNNYIRFGFWYLILGNTRQFDNNLSIC